MTLPVGLVTFLLSDIEGSTQLLRRVGDQQYREILETHRSLVRSAIDAHDGVEVNTAGDSFLVAFSRPRDGVYAALAAQHNMTHHEWPDNAVPRVRIGLHLGHAEADNDRGYIALALHQAARVGAVPHGGQVVITRGLADAIGQPPGLAMTPLGSFWLKDFPEPVPLVVVSGQSEDADLRPPRAPRADLNNLPALRGAFVGRAAELETVARAVAEPGLVTIIGPGGVGKTRLALEVGARIAADGGEAWVVELAGVTSRSAAEPASDLGGIAAAVARTIGSEAATTIELVRQLSTSSMTLVIDNAEHVLEPVADLVEALLRDCPQLALVVTSRSPLAISAERVFRLTPLPIPRDDASPSEIDQSPAVQLFASRARAADSAFVLGQDNRTEVLELCQMLDGLPLALELAAARVSILAPEALVERVRAVGDLPGIASRGSRSRHATLHAVLDWSLSLCDETEVAVLRRMAAFAGPVRLDAIVEVASSESLNREQVVDALVGLVDKSLVVHRGDRTPLYDLLVTVRQAAFSRLLAEQERDEALRRHAVWVLDQARAAAPGGLERDMETVRALAVEAEAALERGAAGEIPTDTYADIFVTLRDHYYTRQQHLGIQHGRRLAEAELDATVRAECLYIASKAMLELQHPEFATVTREAVALARTSGHQAVLARALIGLMEVDLLQGPDISSESLEAMDEAISIFSDIAGTSVRSDLTLSIVRGWRALNDGDAASAIEWHTQCLEMSRRHGAAFFEATSHFNLAEAYERSGDPARAVEEYELAARTSFGFGGIVSGTDALISATALLTSTGSAEAAADLGAEAVLAARRARSDVQLRAALLALADAAAAAGNHQAAHYARNEAQSISPADLRFAR